MQQETILIIDDEISIRESLSSFFTDEGYRVLTAQNGEEGLNLFFKENIDIVVTDLKMPIKGGLEVMDSIHSHNPDIPMVVVSGAGKRQDIIKALQMGAKDYITKPITDLNMIRHVIEKALENKYLIEQNKEYRLRLEKSEAKYRTITEQIAEGVLTMDADENITFCNQAFCTMLGHPQEELCRMNLKNLATPESMLTISEGKISPSEGLAGRYEIQLINRDSSPVHVELVCSPLYDEFNRYTGAIAVARDITKLIALRNQYQTFLKKEENKSRNIVAICANCKSVRGEEDKWLKVEEYFNQLSFSHGICPSCCQQLYPDIDIDELDL